MAGGTVYTISVADNAVKAIPIPWPW